MNFFYCGDSIRKLATSLQKDCHKLVADLPWNFSKFAVQCSSKLVLGLSDIFTVRSLCQFWAISLATLQSFLVASFLQILPQWFKILIPILNSNEIFFRLSFCKHLNTFDATRELNIFFNHKFNCNIAINFVAIFCKHSSFLRINNLFF